MISRDTARTFFDHGLRHYLPHLSVDCVVFGVHEGRLTLLLLKWKNSRMRVLPGGYVGAHEGIESAARRVLRERTGLRRVALRQFHAFGAVDRGEADLRRLLGRLGITTPPGSWVTGRVVSIGYYALVDAARVRPRLDDLSDAWEWHPVDERLPRLAFDHRVIVREALAALRASLASGTPERPLLPGSFTMPELQRVHEAILGRSLDRRNFQKQMLQRGVLERLPERRTGGAHRPAFLYRFTR